MKYKFSVKDIIYSVSSLHGKLDEVYDLLSEALKFGELDQINVRIHFKDHMDTLTYQNYQLEDIAKEQAKGGNEK